MDEKALREILRKYLEKTSLLEISTVVLIS